MKWVVWFLVLLNVGMFAYFRLSEPQTGVVQVGHRPIEPEKIQILTPEQVEAMPKKTAQAPAPQPINEVPVQYSCYEWGTFSASSLQRARKVLSQLSLEATTQQQSSQEAVRYWVYVPPQRSLQDAQAKVDDLHAHGVQDSFVVQEPQWRFAVSLGIFKDEKLASALLNDLRGRGIDYVVKGVRNQEKGRASLLISKMTHDMAGEIDKLKPEFPGSELKEVGCQ